MAREIKLIKAEATPQELNEIFELVLTWQERRETLMLNPPLWGLIKELVLNAKKKQQQITSTQIFSLKLKKNLKGIQR